MKPFDFRVKRISRMYYWIALIISNAVSAGVGMVLFVEYNNQELPAIRLLIVAEVIFVLLYQALLIIKRFHDVGKSTGYAVFCILLAPIGIGSILIFLVTIKESDGDNRWGKNEEKWMYEKERD